MASIVKRSKPQITLDMAAENVRTVAKRLGVKKLTFAQYEAEGSFSVRTLADRWGWKNLCAHAGIGCGEQHKPYSVKAKWKGRDV